MKPAQLEQLLLLDQSGELTPRQQAHLAAALADSAHARELRDQLRHITRAVTAPETAPAMPASLADAVARIDARLRRPRPLLAVAWKPLLAAAAALVLLVGATLFHITRHPAAASEQAALADDTELDTAWLDPMDAEFTELEDLLASIATDDFFLTMEM